jgi:hypothetical protein
MAKLPLVKLLPFPTHPHWAQIFWLIRDEELITSAGH